MGIFKRKTEIRADEGTVQFEDALLAALLSNQPATKEMALQIPTVSGGIDLIANVVASTPIKLYRDKDGKAEEVRDDYRIPLLNDETGDTLSANEFWHAIIRDYYTGKGGYAYINRQRGRIRSIHYVDEREVTINRNADPIFKDFDILVAGGTYKPYDFLKILRNTKDGAQGVPITTENSQLITTAYQQLILEYTMARRGGNKKGFLVSEKKLDDKAMETLRKAWSNLYSNEKEMAIVLNNGVNFKESSDTAAEMQLTENKDSNAKEFAKIFHVSADAISGKEGDITGLAKLAAIPLMTAIQCALNKDLLLEKEKGELYFAFDTKELLKGSVSERADYYKKMIDANVMQIDEVRYMEDLPALGVNFIKLGLQDVLFDPKTKEIYTPNTNQFSSLQDRADDDNIKTEERGKDNWIKGAHGYFAGSAPSSGGAAASSASTASGPPNWTKKEQKEPFDYYSMQEDKTGYPRHLTATGFSSEETLASHFADHGKSVGAKDEADYVKKAKSFFESPRGKNGDAFVRKNGDACRYDYGTHEFVSVTKSGVIKTYFNLLDGRSANSANDYWRGEKSNG